MAKRWNFRSYDPETIRRIESSTGVAAILAQLLSGRGIDHPEAVKGFMNPKLSLLRDPRELPGSLAVAERILAAIRSSRKIIVYGDYDVDGMTATAILTKAIKILGGVAGYYIPSRLDEGYGLRNESLKKLSEEGAEVIITVDCGISCCEEAKTARELGIELLITDHHTPGPELPEVNAIAHPQLIRWKDRFFSPQSEEILEFAARTRSHKEAEEESPKSYPFPELSGAMVALKVVWALGQLASGEEKVSGNFREFLLEAVGLATLGTIADVVPLIDENRHLVRFGLENSLSKHVSIGFRELCRVAGLKDGQQISSESVGFQIAPRLNAAGRLGQAQLGVELLLTGDGLRAKELAQYINGLNESRQKLERSILKEANRQIKELYDQDAPAYVLACPDWHSGVIGIVAGRLSDQFHRPVIMIAQDKMGLKAATGSARAIPGFNLYNALRDCGEHLERYGGHASAAGLGVLDSNIDAFRASFLQYAEREFKNGIPMAELLLDGEFPFGAFTVQTVSQIEEMAPFGCANRRPVLCTFKVYLSDNPKPMGADNRHFSAVFEQGGITFRGVSFGNAHWIEEMRPHGLGPFDIAFHVVLNTFAGRCKVELQLLDWKPSS